MSHIQFFSFMPKEDVVRVARISILSIPECLDQAFVLKIMTTLEGIRHLICCNYALAR